MANKVDSILSTFTKTIGKLNKEAEKQAQFALAAERTASIALEQAGDARDESRRASNIASNLEEVINGG